MPYGFDPRQRHHVGAKSALLRLLFCLWRKRSHPPAPLLLLFRKRARSARLRARIPLRFVIAFCTVLAEFAKGKLVSLTEFTPSMLRRHHPFAGVCDRN